MEIKFKQQDFQRDAAQAVCDVFAGQPFLTPSYMIDPGAKYIDPSLFTSPEYTGWSNAPIVPELTDAILLQNLRRVQNANGLKPSDGNTAWRNLTIEMETGVGKTYTYIKTMYELSARYGWNKYIIVVPSVAIREGVYKSLQMTEQHFADEYGKRIRYFIYSSTKLDAINSFARDGGIHCMIINVQAFNAKSRDARRITMKLDEFQSRVPMDVIAQTNPILIIDEPQSVNSAQTLDKLRAFRPLFTLRYSATPPKGHSLIYRLDALDAYNRKLVKKIAVKGISTSAATGASGYIYLEGINVSKGAPTAALEIDIKGKAAVTRKRFGKVRTGFNLYENSNGLTAYKKGFVVTDIDARDNSITFVNGLTMHAGQVVGHVNEDDVRRLQIRETILSHFERERQLWSKGIKVLSLFFIDRVDKYRVYAGGTQQNGAYANMFEEEYAALVDEYAQKLNYWPEFVEMLRKYPPQAVHAGYFSIDSHKQYVDSKAGDNRREMTSNDTDAYDLIMKNKERLLDQKEPVRFIFSHSALREGWDNPNVFQICTLKQSDSTTRKRQEVGRGMRLCVNQNGDRQDADAVGAVMVHDINVLTVVASESYGEYTRTLQKELHEDIDYRPEKVTTALFEGKTIIDSTGAERVIDHKLAKEIMGDLGQFKYVECEKLTDAYFADRKNNTVQFTEAVRPVAEAVLSILDGVYDEKHSAPEDARQNTVSVHINQKQYDSEAFKALWAQINSKSAYAVSFDTRELVKKSIDSLNKNLQVRKLYLRVEQGELRQIPSREELLSGDLFTAGQTTVARTTPVAAKRVKYDLIGRIAADAGLTRAAAADILRGLEPEVFGQFKDNPEDFILRACGLINEQKATVIIDHIVYNKLEQSYDMAEIFTEPGLKGRAEVNALPAKKHLYDYVLYDSDTERKFAEELEHTENVSVYVKLPRGFYITTPVGKYNPDWAIAFEKGSVRHIYFVAETKGDLSTLELRGIEDAKIKCGIKHFGIISENKVKFDKAATFADVLDKVL